MSELLASYWRMPVKSGRTTKTAYLDLFDNGISTNVVLFVDRFKLQLPKWVLRDFLSLGTIIYPDAPINRRENPERVEIKDVMTERLTAAGFRYSPGHAHTYLPDARTDPDAALESISGRDPARTIPEPVTRADLARAGRPGEMFNMILNDVKEAEQRGVSFDTGDGFNELAEAHGWARFEVSISRELRRVQTLLKQEMEHDG